jgi:hypothetical protein
VNVTASPVTPPAVPATEAPETPPASPPRPAPFLSATALPFEAGKTFTPYRILDTLLQDFVRRYLIGAWGGTDEQATLFEAFHPSGTVELLRRFMCWLADPATGGWVSMSGVLSSTTEFRDELQMLAPSLSAGNYLNPDFQIQFPGSLPPEHADYDSRGATYTWSRLMLLLLNLALYQPEQTADLDAAHLGGWVFVNPNFQALCRFLFEREQTEVESRTAFVGSLLHDY